MPIMSPLFSTRMVISLLILFQLLHNAEGQTSYALVGGSASITSNSIYNDDQCQPTDCKYSIATQCWCSLKKNCADSPYLNVNLGGVYKVTRVGVKSCSWNEYIRSYKIQYYDDGGVWRWYNNGQRLTGNSGCCSEEATDLTPITATQIRLYPLTASSWCSTNFEAYGYPVTLTQSPTYTPPATLVPTRNPTPAPTRNPATSPTHAPTRTPTPAPTHNPTVGPVAPTRNPIPASTRAMTSNPSVSSQTTTKTTSRVNTYASVLEGSAVSADRMETSQLRMNTVDDMVLYNLDTNLDENNGDIWSSNAFVFSAIGIGVAICCLMVGLCYLRRRRRQRKKHVIHYKLKSNSSNHMVSVDVGAIIMTPGHSVLPVFSPNNSQDSEVYEEEELDNDLDPLEFENGLDPLELVDLAVLTEGAVLAEGAVMEETTQHFMNEYYDEDEMSIDCADHEESQDGDRSTNTVSLDESY